MLASFSCLIALAITAGCSRSSSLVESMSKEYRFQWPLPYSDLKGTRWKDGSALEGVRRTTITLARIEMSKESLEQFLGSLSNRIDVVDMPDSPPRNAMFEQKAVWWDLDEHNQHRYFEIDQVKERSGKGKLQAYLVETSEPPILYLYSRRR
jgi:hypothetical protein